VLYDHLTPAEAEATEREILHDRDVVHALIALSGEVSLVVIAARSGPATGDEQLGDTIRALIGRTACPVAVLPPCAEAVATASMPRRMLVVTATPGYFSDHCSINSATGPSSPAGAAAVTTTDNATPRSSASAKAWRIAASSGSGPMTLSRMGPLDAAGPRAPCDMTAPLRTPSLLHGHGADPGHCPGQDRHHRTLGVVVELAQHGGEPATSATSVSDVVVNGLDAITSRTMPSRCCGSVSG
jgi:hypothetical protein